MNCLPTFSDYWGQTVWALLLVTSLSGGGNSLLAQDTGGQQVSPGQRVSGTFEAEVRGGLQFNFRGRAYRQQIGSDNTQLFSGLVLQLQGGGGYSHCTLTILENGTGREGQTGTYPITVPDDSLPGQDNNRRGFQAFFGCQTPDENYYYQAQEGAIELQSFPANGSVTGRIGLIAQRRGGGTGQGETIRVRGQFFAQPQSSQPDTTAEQTPPTTEMSGSSPATEANIESPSADTANQGS